MGGTTSGAAAAAAWAALRGLPHRTLGELFAADPARHEALTRRIAWPVEPGIAAEAGMRIDFSKTHLSDEALTAFEALAEAAGFAAARENLFGGGIVNVTEGRAATHGALRGSGTPAAVEEAAPPQDDEEKDAVEAVAAEAEAETEADADPADETERQEADEACREEAAPTFLTEVVEPPVAASSDLMSI